MLLLSGALSALGQVSLIEEHPIDDDSRFHDADDFRRSSGESRRLVSEILAAIQIDDGGINLLDCAFIRRDDAVGR